MALEILSMSMMANADQFTGCHLAPDGEGVVTKGSHKIWNHPLLVEHIMVS